MTYSTMMIEPWESGYMWFLVPGFLTWLAATVWWGKARSSWVPVVFQGIGVIEVLLGGAAACCAVIVSAWTPNFPGNIVDPWSQVSAISYGAHLILIAWWVHWFLLVGTMIMVCLTVQRRHGGSVERRASR